MPHRRGLVFVPIHRQIDSRRVEPFGTGTLIDFGDANVLVSAAHVFAEGKKHRLLVAGSPTGVALTGKVVTSSLASRNAGTNDPYDLAFGFLTKQHRARIEATGAKFLPHTAIVESERISEAKRCVFCGYPISQSTTRVGAMLITSTPFYATCSIVRSDDPQSEEYIVGRYNREQMVSDETGIRVKGPEVWGISGGPVWLSFEDGTNALAGIGTDYDPVRHRLRGTRLEALVAQVSLHKPQNG
jgi:hypothetical protein